MAVEVGSGCRRLMSDPCVYGIPAPLPVLLMYHPSMGLLAEKLVLAVSRFPDQMKGKGGSCRKLELWQSIEWNHFKDGWPNLFIANVHEIAGRDVIFLASFHSPELIFEQLSLIYTLPRYLVRSFRLILPFFPTGTMERVDKEGQIVTAKSLAIMLSQIPLAARGPAQIVIFDIHSLQERFYFSQQVIPRLKTAIPLLCRELQQLEDSVGKGCVAVAFPDEGAWKRFHVDLDQWPIITCTKVRQKDKRFVSVKEGEPEGRHVVIVDDLVQSGQTLLDCAKVLQLGKAVSISAFVTHPVFPQRSWERFTAEQCEVTFANVWITDSIPHAEEIARHPPFKLLSLCDILTDFLLE